MINMTNETIIVAVGEEYTVSLRSIPATGYVWQTEALPKNSRFLGSDYEKSESALPPGAPTRQIFRFRTMKAGEYKLSFVLKRQWESNAIETRIVAVNAI
jgi:predicted secreted protein